MAGIRHRIGALDPQRHLVADRVDGSRRCWPSSSAEDGSRPRASARSITLTSRPPRPNRPISAGGASGTGTVISEPAGPRRPLRRKVPSARARAQTSTRDRASAVPGRFILAARCEAFGSVVKDLPDPLLSRVDLDLGHLFQFPAHGLRHGQPLRPEGVFASRCTRTRSRKSFAVSPSASTTRLSPSMAAAIRTALVGNAVQSPVVHPPRQKIEGGNVRRNFYRGRGSAGSFSQPPQGDRVPARTRPRVKVQNRTQRLLDKGPLAEIRSGGEIAKALARILISPTESLASRGAGEAGALGETLARRREACRPAGSSGFGPGSSGVQFCRLTGLHWQQYGSGASRAAPVGRRPWQGLGPVSWTRKDYIQILEGGPSLHTRHS